VVFDLGIPFRPFEQLTAVLPPLSFSLLPSIYHPILMSPPISNYYPNQLVIDLSQGIPESSHVELRFIDEQMLLDAVEPLHSQLSLQEQKRNTNRNESLLLVSNIFVGKEENLLKLKNFGALANLCASTDVMCYEISLTNSGKLKFGIMPGTIPPLPILDREALCHCVPFLRRELVRKQRANAKKEEKLQTEQTPKILPT